MTPSDKAKVIRAAEMIVEGKELFCCVALVGSSATHLSEEFSEFCSPTQTMSGSWFDDNPPGPQRQLARTLALLMFAEVGDE